VRKFFLLLGIPFFAAGVLIFLFGVMPDMERSSIHQNGTPGVGEFIVATTNVTKNDVPYYKIKFQYTDGTGNQKTDSTSSAYTEAEVLAITQEGKLDIKYNEKGAVQADFGFDGVFYMLIVMSLLFGGLGAIFLALFMLGLIKSGKLKNEGSDVVAKFVSCASNVVINNEKRYYIEVAYRDPNTGKVQTAKTDTIYKHYETEFFRQLGELKARCYENMAMILEDREKAKEMLLNQPTSDQFLM
jgi:hypothetical protein